MGVPPDPDRVPTCAELDEAKRAISRVLYDAALAAHRRQVDAAGESGPRTDSNRKEAKRAVRPSRAPREAP
jgi:hypothetical protein